MHKLRFMIPISVPVLTGIKYHNMGFHAATAEISVRLLAATAGQHEEHAKP